MNVICLEDEAFYSLVENVVKRLKAAHDVQGDKWVGREEAMRLLGVKKSKLQAMRDAGEIRFSQPQRKNIVYDRASIEEYLERHANKRP